jgi:competence protein ComEC
LPATPVFAATAPPVWLLLAAVLLALATVVVKPTARGALLASALLCTPHFLPAPAPAATFRLLAVGHGQTAVATLADGTNVVVDCGSMQRGPLPARKVAAALPRRRIDVLVVSHDDADHTDSVPDLLRRLPVGLAVLPERMQASATAALLRTAGAALHFVADGASFAPCAGVEIRSPAVPAGATDNEASLWTRIDLGPVGILLPGDAECEGTTAAIDADIAGPADILVLPHHGRLHGAVVQLLDAVTPRVALASNRAGEGRSASGDLAAMRGIRTFATGEVGDITVSAAAGGTVATELPMPCR